jgi:hypothetical protein
LASNPFRITMYRPAVYKLLGDLNAAGIPSKFPQNVYSVVTNKGLEVYSGIRRLGSIKTIIEIPAGAESQDPESISAMYVMHSAALHVNAAAIRDALVSGTI